MQNENTEEKSEKEKGFFDHLLLTLDLKKQNNHVSR